MTSAFWPGVTPARTSSMPTKVAMARAADSLSPVSRTVRRPIACNAATASRESGFTSSAIAISPRRRTPEGVRSATWTRVRPAGASEALSVSFAFPFPFPFPGFGARSAYFSIRVSLPTKSVAGYHAQARLVVEAVGVGQAQPPLPGVGGDRLGQRVLAVLLGRRRERRTSSPGTPSSGTTSATTGFPRVTVPVLSSTTVSIFSAFCSASMSRIRMPRLAPRPVPTIRAAGIARPSAQGQAMIKHAAHGLGQHGPGAGGLPAVGVPPGVPAERR